MIIIVNCFYFLDYEFIMEIDDILEGVVGGESEYYIS